MVNGLAVLGKSLSFFQARSKRDKDVARVIIAELNGRDTVHARVCNEHCRATYESVRSLRAAVNAQLGKEMSTDLAFVLRELETSCRQYMRAMEKANLADKPILPHHGPEMEKFGEILDAFQESAQKIGLELAAKYHIVLP
jgi:hypothetical protein